MWLSSQPGYRSKLSYSDTAYFKNNRKNARIAHTQREVPYPSMEACFKAFTAMPAATDCDKRDKALFAFMMLTGARIGATGSLKLLHINLEERHVCQDAREVATKNAKTIDTWFLPVDSAYLDVFTAWVAYLKQELLFGPADALFPKPRIGVRPGQGFANLGLSRECYAGTTQLNKVIRKSFAAVQLPEYTPHSIRKTLVHHGNEVCPDIEAMKAWSLNLGHERLATTLNSYLPVNRTRQRQIIKQMRDCAAEVGPAQNSKTSL
ncbi:tyrosine-type recombinase/integrase [Fluviibacterium sp. S390]|uniref:tyrosine-type recombinase/integrase n=1 Tax=Fluviibacterium sp. S390 TaxID=3415139 RepID=UPI003C79C18C